MSATEISELGSVQPFMPDRQIFFDPQRKRWKRLRRVLDAAAVLSTLVLVGFTFNIIRSQRLPELWLPHQSTTSGRCLTRTRAMRKH